MRPNLLRMATEKRRARPAVKYGPTAETVAANVARLRKARGWSIYALAGELEKRERPITASAIAKLEKTQRQVSVDDLVALAAALRVNPSALLLPLTDDATETCEITGVGAVDANRAWDWMDGEMPIASIEPGDPTGELLLFEVYARPPGRRMLAPSTEEE